MWRKNKTESTLLLLELVQCSLTTPLHTALHYTSLHFTKLHITVFHCKGNVRAISRTQEKRDYDHFCPARTWRCNVLIWLSFKPDRSPCRPLLHSVTRVTQTLARYESIGEFELNSWQKGRYLHSSSPPPPHQLWLTHPHIHLGYRGVSLNTHFVYCRR
jgi:hypothetical protein